MIDKVKKYLLRHDEINIYKKNCSGSEYYRVGNSIIRVSDHIPTSDNQPDVLNIIISGDNFIVMYGNKIINVNDYNDFKIFLKYHIKMCDCFKDIINAGLGRQSNDYIAREAKKRIESSNNLAIKQPSLPEPEIVDGIPMPAHKGGTYVPKRVNFNFNQFYGMSKIQIAWFETQRFPSRIYADDYLKKVRTKIKKHNKQLSI